MTGYSQGYFKPHRPSPDKGRQPQQWHTQPARPLITVGSVNKRKPVAFIYAGTSEDGRIKVGMTTNLDRRAAELQIKIIRSQAVCPPAAKEVETQLFQLLDHQAGETEWLKKPLATVLDAFNVAFDHVRRLMWVDPHLTEEEAKAQRIRMALDRGALSDAPIRPDRKVSIVSFRKAVGTFGAFGGKF